MSYIEEKRIYYINSENRTSGEHSNFSYKFEIPANKFDYVVCLDACIPKSYYLVQSPRNTFVLKEDNKQETITVPEGNYSLITFSKYITLELNNKSPNGYTYSITHNNQGKYEYEVKNYQSNEVSIICTNGLYEQLGFERDSKNIFVNNKITSKNVLNFQHETTLFLRSDIVSSGYGDDVLQQIFTAGKDEFTNIVYKCDDVQAYCKRLNNTSSNQYHFYLTNENGEYINTNGRNLVFIIMLFKKSHVNENLNKYVKYVSDFIHDFRNKRI